MKITLAQLNPIVGDLVGNFKKLAVAARQAHQSQSDLIITSELFVTGYPPQDLLFNPDFMAETYKILSKIKKLSQRYPELGILVGLPLQAEEQVGKKLYNSAILYLNGQQLGHYHKKLLPTYDVFDEARYFATGPETRPINFKTWRLGITICEDGWSVAKWAKDANYALDPVANMVKQGVDCLINLSASPFRVGISEKRYQIFRHHAKKHQLPLVLVNQTGGNDELVFDGSSLVFDAKGRLVFQAGAFTEQVTTLDLTSTKPQKLQPVEPIRNIYTALIVGLRDYVQKCGFKRVVLGLSGGIDSAVVACLAAAALGSKNVLGITMPSAYSSTGSVADSQLLAENLGVDFQKVAIGQLYDSFVQSLAPLFQGRAADLTEENLQARIRGTILMAVSNKTGALLLSTGNKSELAVGYCTLYGDMCGGLDVLSDVPKQMVYELAHYINRAKIVIPESTIEKAPSAELRPDQKDQDSLPPYAVLDHMIAAFVEEQTPKKALTKAGYSNTMLDWFLNIHRKSEHKRRQAAPGIKITSKAFGMGRKMPIAARY